MNEQEFTELYKKAYARTCSIFFRRGYSPEDCDDLAQEVFLEIWRDKRAAERASDDKSRWVLWTLKVALIQQRANKGRYSSPLDSLISIRNLEEHLHIAGTTPPLEQDDEIAIDDFLKNLPEHLATEVRGCLAGLTYEERRRVSGLQPIDYMQLRKDLSEDPVIQEYLLNMR